MKSPRLSFIEKEQEENNNNNSKSYMFPTLDILINGNSTIQKNPQRKLIRPSPYDIEDNNNFGFNIQSNLIEKDLTIKSPRFQNNSKSPPPRHNIRCIPQNLFQSKNISIENYNPEIFTNFTDNFTIEAIEKLGLNQNNLFYSSNSTQEIKDLVLNNIEMVKKEKEKLISRSIVFGEKKKIEKHTFIHQKRSDLEIQQTFGSDTSRFNKENNIHHQRSASLAIENKNFERIYTTSTFERIQKPSKRKK